MNFIINSTSGLVYRFYKESIENHIKKCILLTVFELITFLMVRYFFPNISNDIYGIYCTIYVINSLFVITKILDKITTTVKQKIIITPLQDNIIIIYTYIKILAGLHFTKLLLQVGSCIFDGYWLSINRDWILPISIVIIFADMFYSHYTLIKLLGKNMINTFDNSILKLLDIYIILYILLTICSFI